MTKLVQKKKKERGKGGRKKPSIYFPSLVEKAEKPGEQILNIKH